MIHIRGNRPAMLISPSQEDMMIVAFATASSLAQTGIGSTPTVVTDASITFTPIVGHAYMIGTRVRLSKSTDGATWSFLYEDGSVLHRMTEVFQSNTRDHTHEGQFVFVPTSGEKTYDLRVACAAGTVATTTAIPSIIGQIWAVDLGVAP